MRPILHRACLFALSLIASFAQAAPGDFDHSFGQNGIFRLPNPATMSDSANFVTTTDDGKVLATGYYSSPIGGGDILARLQTNGKLDPVFADNGVGRSVINPIFDTSGTFEIPQANGRVIQIQRRWGAICGAQFSRAPCQPGQVSLSLPNFYAQRFENNGAPDPTFGVGGIAFSSGEFDDVIADSRGAFKIFGRTAEPPYRPRVVNYGPNGEPFPTDYFQKAVNSLSACANRDPNASEVRVRATDAGDGRVFVVQQSTGGAQSSFGGLLCVIRLENDGTIDTTWGDSGVVVNTRNLFGWGGQPMVLARRPDGGLILAFGANTGGRERFHYYTIVLALNSSGISDPSWGGDDGKSISNALVGRPDAAMLQRDGKLLIAGEASEPGTVIPRVEAPGTRLLRLLSNGEPDLSFGSSGRGFAAVDSVDNRMLVKHIHEARDGAIFLAGGIYSSVSAEPTTGTRIYQFTVAKLLAADPLPPQSNSSSSGGGGCGSINTRIPPDPVLPGMAILAALWLNARSRRRITATLT